MTHAPADLLPLLRRLDENFGGQVAARPIESRARSWAHDLSDLPIASLTHAVDLLIRTHAGHYPVIAQVRAAASEHRRLHAPAASGSSETCDCCGEPYGWHRLARPGLPETPRGWAPDWMVPAVTRLVIRHREGFRCSRFNAAHHFEDAPPMEAA